MAAALISSGKKLRAEGIKKTLFHVGEAQNSVGFESGEVTRLRIWIWVNDYTAKAEQLEKWDEYLVRKVMEIQNVEKKLAIKGAGLSKVIGFVAEVDEIGCFIEPRQIQKLAGFVINKISVGKRKSRLGISKRGRCKLLRMRCKLARSLFSCNPVFQDVFLHYRN